MLGSCFVFGALIVFFAVIALVIFLRIMAHVDFEDDGELVNDGGLWLTMSDGGMTIEEYRETVKPLRDKARQRAKKKQQQRMTAGLLSFSTSIDKHGAVSLSEVGVGQLDLVPEQEEETLSRESIKDAPQPGRKPQKDKTTD